MAELASPASILVVAVALTVTVVLSRMAKGPPEEGRFPFEDLQARKKYEQLGFSRVPNLYGLEEEEVDAPQDHFGASYLARDFPTNVPMVWSSGVQHYLQRQ